MSDLKSHILSAETSLENTTSKAHSFSNNISAWYFPIVPSTFTAPHSSGFQQFHVSLNNA